MSECLPNLLGLGEVVVNPDTEIVSSLVPVELTLQRGHSIHMIIVRRRDVHKVVHTHREREREREGEREGEGGGREGEK